MDTNPDSALFVLKNEIDKQKLSESEHALWCLLTTKAMDKGHIKHISDTLISIARKYYEKQDDKDLLMETYYYLGRVHHDMKNLLWAQEYYLKALATGKDSRNYTILSRICYNISYLYLYQKAHEEALRFQKKSLYYASENDSTAKAYSLRDIARSFSVKYNLDSALYYYDEAFKYADDANKFHIYNELGIVHRQKEDYKTSYYYIQKALELTPEDENEQHKALYSNLGYTYLGLNKTDSAFICLQNAVQSNNLSTKGNATYYLYKLFKQKGDIKKALLYLEETKLLFDSINKKNRLDAIQRMQVLHDYHEAKTRIATLETKNAIGESNLYRAWIIAIACTILLVAISFAFFHFMKSVKKRKNEFHTNIEQNITRIKELEKLIVESQNEITHIKIENEKLKDQQKKQETATDDLKASGIYQKIHLAARDIKNNKKTNINITLEDKKALITTIEEIYPEFSSRIIQRYPSINDEELYLCYLYKADIKSPSILSHFLHISSNAVINRRSRLGGKLFNKQGDKEKFNQFIGSL
ncbi:tetratricopeptide repeat protein [Bacteroides sp. 519]|nr:tetratricopeptide repeat protein [Bacteroides sp. 519]